MGAATAALNKIGNGLKQVLDGVTHVAKSVLTLDLKGAAQGLTQAVGGIATAGTGAFGLTPAALAANTLMNGALDDFLEKGPNMALNTAGSVLNKAAGLVGGFRA